MKKAKHSVERKIYFTDDEWKEIERRAALVGKRPNIYIREIAVHGEIKRFTFSEYQTLVFPLRGIGVNINQIATVANSTGSVFKKDIEDIKDSFRQLKTMFEEHFKEMKYDLIE